MEEAWKQGEGGGSSDGLLIGGWEKIYLHLFTKFRQNINPAFYILSIAMHTHLKQGQEWFIINTERRFSLDQHFAEAERQLNDQQNQRFNLDNIDNILKVVLARQPLLGTVPLPDWLRNLARGRRVSN